MTEIFQNREQKFQLQRASHAILMHRRGLSTFHRGCEASQRVAGPYGGSGGGGYATCMTG